MSPWGKLFLDWVGFDPDGKFCQPGSNFELDVVANDMRIALSGARDCWRGMPATFWIARLEAMSR